MLVEIRDTKMSASETSATSAIDVRMLVRWLGSHGAKAGLLQSKECTTEVLHQIAKNLGVEVEKNPNRQRLVDEIVRVASRRIDKSLDELYTMSQAELTEYFNRVDARAEELLELLQKLDLSPRKESRRNLIDFASRELSETGRFMRIATSGTKKTDNGRS